MNMKQAFITASALGASAFFEKSGYPQRFDQIGISKAGIIGTDEGLEFFFQKGDEKFSILKNTEQLMSQMQAINDLDRFFDEIFSRLLVKAQTL